MASDLAPDGPFKLEMKVKLVGVSGQYEGYEAWADIDLPPGRVPSDAEISERIQTALREAGEGFELADRHGFLQGLMQEHTGTNISFAVPGANDFRLVPA